MIANKYVRKRKYKIKFGDKFTENGKVSFYEINDCVGHSWFGFLL